MVFQLIYWLSLGFREHFCQKRRPLSRFCYRVPTNRYEVMKLHAVMIMMGINPCPQLSIIFLAIKTSTVHSTQTPFHQRTSGISPCFVLVHAAHLRVIQQYAKKKTDMFVNKPREKFNDAVMMSEVVSVPMGETTGSGGRYKYKQFNILKPHKYHIKSIGLLNSSMEYCSTSRTIKAWKHFIKILTLRSGTLFISDTLYYNSNFMIWLPYFSLGRFSHWQETLHSCAAALKEGISYDLKNWNFSTWKSFIGNMKIKCYDVLS